MAKLSVAIITFNEERNIERCLQSLTRVADEIVVVDSFSTDTTKAICNRYNVVFSEHVFDGYSEQKNRAAALCSNELILSLDADEALSTELEQSILEVKKQPQADAYTFNRATHFCGQHIKGCGWYPDANIRLWKANAGQWTGSKVHEKFTLKAEAKIQHIKGDLLHYSYYSIEEHIAQINKFSTLSALKKFEKGKRSSILAITLFPRWRFFRDYIIKRGFLDGYYGYVISKNAAHEVFLKYTKLRDLWKNNQH